jgi:dihydrodipicolinate synthase/N-acetylneuraminate lyase
MKKAYGIFPPMLTIWDKDENYDEKASERYIKWMIDSGVQSIVTCGSTSENTAMKTDEQKRVIEHVVKTVAGQVPVYAGTGKYTTLETLELSKHAKAVGADGLLVILPYYFHPYKAAVMDHFRTIKREVGLPILVYNNPWFAGYEMTAQEIKQLYDEGVIEGVMDMIMPVFRDWYPELTVGCPVFRRPSRNNAASCRTPSWLTRISSKPKKSGVNSCRSSAFSWTLMLTPKCIGWKCSNGR